LFEVLDHEVLTVEEINTGNQVATVKRFYAFSRKLVITGLREITTNSTAFFTVIWQDWQDHQLQDENSPITVKIVGAGQPVEFILTPENGQAAFNFASPIPGTFKITAAAAFPCTPAEMEVVVNA